MRILPLLLLAACTPVEEPADDPTPVVSELSLDLWAQPGPGGVGVTTQVLVDHDRPTPAHGAELGLPERTLTVETWYPAAQGGVDQSARDVPPLAGPHPLLVWAHGFMSDRLDHAGLGRFLASHGYVVASIGFPLSGRGTAGGADAADVINQPGDVSFVVDSLIAADGLLAGAVDGDLLAVGGLSLGGMTTALVGMHPAVSDDRIDALLPVAPATCALGLESFDAPNPPMLIVHGTADAVLAHDEHALALFERATGPRWLASLIGGTHTGFPDVTAGLFDDLEHADSVGCGTIEGSVETSTPVIVDPVDGEGDILGPDCSAPCVDLAGYGRGMRPTRQVRLLMALARAFLDAQLRGDADALLWLEAGIGLQEEDVDLLIGG